MDPQQQFCLKWNSYSSNLAITFSNLFKSDLLADVILSCDGAVFKAHKLILAACSKKFADLFENTPTNGQCVIILEATTPDNMAALLEFMYKGEVHVSQEALNSFLKSAESLQVKGLSTETGRLAAQQAQQQHMGDSSPLDSPTGRRSIRNSLSGGGNIVHGGVGAGGVGMGGGGAGANSIPGGLGNGNGLSLAGALSAAGGMAAAASVAASGLSALAASANALDRCTSAGGNIIGGTAAGIGPLSGGSGTGAGSGIGGVGGNGVGGGNNGPISLGSGAGAALHLGGSTGSLKQECDSLMHPSSSSSSSGMGYTHVPPIYRPISYEPLRKRALRSPYAEQEQRGSVLRDGSKNSLSECPSPINKPPYHRPSSSASSTAPTEADTMHSERASPQSSRYENHSPSTTAGNGNATSGLDRIVKSERNNGSANEANDDDRELMDESTDNGAEDLRVKLENSNYSPPPPPNSNTSSTTPNALLENLKNADGSLSGNLAASIAPADMLNVWNATKMNNKNSVNTADGKKLKCLYCDRLYGYETNLRAHIRQRHQGIRVPCPFCERTFTRNNTEAAATAAAAVVMTAHKEAAKQRKRKSLKMALEKCMQRRDALVAEATITTPSSTTGAGEEEGATGSDEGKEGPGAGAGVAGSAGTEPPLTYEQQQQRMHQELAHQIKAAMAAERAQEAMDATVNTTANTTTTTTTTNTTGTTSDGSSDAEASDGSERPMEVDEQPPEPQPGSELLVVEPKIEVLSESEEAEEEEEEDDHHHRLHLHMSEEPEIQAEAVYDRMPTTPTSPQQHIIPPNETPTLTSTPKVNVEQ
ncbi:hypothetical protein KR074_000962 [Drosophila pseudoananassae]|nr:hypothetical protein KR074_000962 [Drosophila pseudoananassae]